MLPRDSGIKLDKYGYLLIPTAAKVSKRHGQGSIPDYNPDMDGYLMSTEQIKSGDYLDATMKTKKFAMTILGHQEWFVAVDEGSV